MKHLAIASTLLLSASLVCAQDDDAGAALAKKVAAAAGADAWSKVTSVSFGWRHVPRDTTRRYAWDVANGRVKVQKPRGEVDLPVEGFGDDDAPEEAVEAHRGWVNDGFWAMAALHLAWDADVTFEDLGQVEVPGFPKLGKRRALKATWASGGYTPGDAYVFYLSDDHKVAAWAFHKGGAEEPRLVCTWEGYVTKGGLTLPSKFVLPDGATVIEIVDLEVETAEQPTSRPTSRPAEQD